MADARRRLAERLRGLREAGISGIPVTQSMVAGAFGRSVPLISSWEKGKAVPGEAWLHAYSRLFASPRSFAGGPPRLLAQEDLHDAELERFEELFGELRQLRSAAGSATPKPAAERPEGGWHFTDGSPVTLVCARRPGDPPVAPDSPDYVELYTYADLDALMELYGHVRAANPGVTVHRKLADDLDGSDVTNHLVLLGRVDRNPLAERVLKELDLPVLQDPDTRSFRVREPDGPCTVLGPTLDEGRLTEDIAQFSRAPNPFNRRRTVTICNGTHVRGTYAAVRTLTDPRFADRNRAHLQGRYGPEDTYSVLARVPVVAGEVITPDWTRDGTVLHEWPGPA